MTVGMKEILILKDKKQMDYNKLFIYKKREPYFQ